MTIEYIAHACFVVESPEGVRVVVDPYNSNRWLGYHFPDNVDADAVLATHPHYDHDASYYWSADVPVFRAPGKYAVGDLSIQGVAGRHADPYGKEFGQRNTMWLIEAGGLRILHLGDNGPLSADAIRQVGRVDILMTPADDLEHILKNDEIRDIRAALKPRVTIPMHYRITSLSELPDSVGPIDKWLAQQQRVRRLGENRVSISAADLPGPGQVWVLPPSPDVKPWGDDLHQAWRLRRSASALRRGDPGKPSEEAIRLLRQSRELAPEAMTFSVELAEALAEAGRGREAVSVLEQALAGAGASDWEYALRGRGLLARLYRKHGEPAKARTQYRLILNDAYRLELRREAEEFLGSAP